MKVSNVSITLALALAANVQAAPANVVARSEVAASSVGLTKRQEAEIMALIADMNAHTTKRGLIHDGNELMQRDYAIVTQILAAINSTGLAPEIILGLVNNKNLQPFVTDAVIAIIKSGLISLNTLFTALTESGLVTRVIKDIINDCEFYQNIYKLAAQYISDLTKKIQSKLAGDSVSVKRWFEEEEEFVVAPDATGLDKRYDPNGVVNQLLESLANSGLASSVVEALIVDPQFLSYGASLIKTLAQQNLINYLGLLSAIIDSGLIPSLFKEFFNLDTLKTVIFNALAAAFDQCGGSTVTGSPTGLTTQSTTTTSLPSFTATQTTLPSGSPSGTVCKRKRRRRSYNY